MPYADPTKQREYQRRWVARRRDEFMSDKTCRRCGSSDSLELHHRDPNKKVSHSIWTWRDERRLAEIDKCIVLCRPCHERYHNGGRLLGAALRNPCGTYASYKRGCHCPSCRAANAAYQRERKARA